MSKKQWGHGFHAGKRKARVDAHEAIKELRSKDMKPFELIHRMMNTHHDKDLVHELHQAMLRSPYSSQYSRSAWLMIDTGEFEYLRENTK